MYAIFIEIDLVLTLLGHFKSQKMACMFCRSEVHTYAPRVAFPPLHWILRLWISIRHEVPR